MSWLLPVIGLLLCLAGSATVCAMPSDASAGGIALCLLGLVLCVAGACVAGVSRVRSV